MNRWLTLEPTHSPLYRERILLRQPQELQAVLPQLLTYSILGLDTETTDLNPRRLRLRSIQLAAPDGRVWIVDCEQVPASLVQPVLAGRQLVGHNLKFDLQVLMQTGLQIPSSIQLFDTMLAAQLTVDRILSKKERQGYYSLQQVTQRELGIHLDKTQQTEDWSGPLTEEKLHYAATDAAVVLQLQQVLADKIQRTGQNVVAAVEWAALPAIAWLELAGVTVDTERWQQLAEQAEQRRQELFRQLRQCCPSVANWNATQRQVIPALQPFVVQLLETVSEDIKSDLQDVLEEMNKGRLEDWALAIVSGLMPSPFRLLREYRSALKASSTYGRQFLERYVENGHLYPHYWQIGAVSGRMSCSKPNIQQIPRQGGYRQCIRPTAGCVFVKADFDQIELRIAARITEDKALLEAYQSGQDLHAWTAQRVLQRQEVSKEDRQLAKAINFGLLYGMGAKTLRIYIQNYGVTETLSLEDAYRVKEAWLTAYPAVRQSQRRTGALFDSFEGSLPVTTRTLLGRRCHVETYCQALDAPVQGTGADILKLAMALLWQTREQCCPDARLVLAVHDELVLEVPHDRAEVARDWLVGCMQDAAQTVLQPVPVRVKAEICSDWTGTPLDSPGSGAE